MTASVVDELTVIYKIRECIGESAVLFSGFIGGMAGCAMIGQSGFKYKIWWKRSPVKFICRGFFVYGLQRLDLVIGLGKSVFLLQ